MHRSHTTRRLPSLTSCVLAGIVTVALGCQDTGTTGLDADPALSDHASRPANASGGTATPVPYRGTLTTTEQTPDPDPPEGCEVFHHTAQIGQSTQLGAYTGTGTTCSYNVRFNVLDPPINPGGGPPPYFVTDFTVRQVHTGANGDQLHVSGVGVFVQSMTSGAAGFVGDGAIEGGTGRFDGATGTFTIRGVRDMAARYDGWIVLDPSALD